MFPDCETSGKLFEISLRIRWAIKGWDGEEMVPWWGGDGGRNNSGEVYI